MPGVRSARWAAVTWSLRARPARPPVPAGRRAGSEAPRLPDAAVELSGDLRPAPAGGASLQDSRRRRAGQGTSAEADPSPARRGEAKLCPVADEVPLELRNRREHRHEEAADRVAARLQVQALGRDHEPDTVQVDELLDVREEVERGPAGAVELVDEQRVERVAARGLEDALEARPVVLGSGPGLLDVEDDPVAEALRGRAQLGTGQRRVLIDRGDPVVQGRSLVCRHADPLTEKGCPPAPSFTGGFYARLRHAGSGRLRQGAPHGVRSVVFDQVVTREDNRRTWRDADHEVHRRWRKSVEGLRARTTEPAVIGTTPSRAQVT